MYTPIPKFYVKTTYNRQIQIDYENCKLLVAWKQDQSSLMQTNATSHLRRSQTQLFRAASEPTVETNVHSRTVCFSMAGKCRQRVEYTQTKTQTWCALCVHRPICRL